MTTFVGILFLLNILNFGESAPSCIKKLKHIIAWGLIVIGLPELIIAYIRLIEHLG